ncbi:MAG: helix-turn-helix transcriptional regulator [Scrofimicrobium sp.]
MEGDLQLTVGANLRRIRQGMGQSQERFAETLGVHRTYLGGLERGERNLTLKSVEKLAEQLSIDPVTLMTPLSD